MKTKSTATCTAPLKTIVVDEKTIGVNESESVLEALERANVEVNYNCREGFCGVCRTKLLSGTVEYRIEPLAFIDDDEILSCCTLPSSNIAIKIQY